MATVFFLDLTGSTARTESLFIAAEAINSEGSRLYHEGNFEAAAARYSEALVRLGENAGYHNADETDERSIKRSKYFASRAQARTQLQDFEMAAQDYRASVDEDPRNAEALIWWGRCDEALGRWNEALKHFESASALLQPGAALLPVALEGGRRARANRDADLKVARAEPMPQELVHPGQMLRLSFREPVPAECRLGEWFSLSLVLSNEFGLWRRSDFGRSTPATRARDKVIDGDGLARRGGREEAGGTFSLPGGFPAGEAAAASYRAGGTTEMDGEAATPAALDKLRLVIEARDLEGFGGRSLAGRPLRSWGDCDKNACAEATKASTQASVSIPRLKGNITAMSGSDSARSPLAFDEGRCVAVEIDGGGRDSAIGSEGKTTVRARFVAVADASVNQQNGRNGGGKVPPIRNLGASLPARSWPRLVLLRVSVVENDARSLLGRWVVPVLSLPIAVLEAGTRRQEPTTVVESTPAPPAGEMWGERLVEQAALAGKISKAGAVGCREVVVPVLRASALTSSSDSSRRQRQRPDWARAVKAAASDGGCNEDDSSGFETVPPPRNGAQRIAGDCSSGGAGVVSNDDGGVRPEEVVMLVAESPGQLGIGGKVWDSAFVLCGYLAEAPAASADAIAPGNGDHASSRARGIIDTTAGELTPLRASGEASVDGSNARPTANGKTSRGHTVRIDEGAIAPTAVGWSSCVGTLVRGKRVLELGAGTGLVSICCALLGAAAVVATDFEDVTELIKVNVALNFSEPPSQPTASAEKDTLSALAAALKTPTTESSQQGPGAQPTKSSSPAAATAGATFAGGKLPDLLRRVPQTGRTAANDRDCGDGGGNTLTPPKLVRRSQTPVVTAPLVWGKSSAEVESFDPEVVVMSDVVYDPAGYEPLLQTLLEIMRPKRIAVMAHRHRHPEDHVFFQRLYRLFHVVEEKEIPRWGETHCSSPKHTAPSSRVQEGEHFEGADVRIFRIYNSV